MKGYKVFKPDWTCRGYQFEVGKTFEEDVDPKCCDRGFHFCTKASDCFNYYEFDCNNKVAEVFSEDVVGDDAKAEYVMLALRTSDGVNLQAYKNTFNSDFTFDFINSIKKNLKYLNVTEKTVKIKGDYLYVQNTILVDFISEKQ